MRLVNYKTMKLKTLLLLFVFLPLCDCITSQHSRDDANSFQKNFEMENSLRNRPDEYRQYKESQEKSKNATFIIKDSIDKEKSKKAIVIIEDLIDRQNK